MISNQEPGDPSPRSEVISNQEARDPSLRSGVNSNSMSLSLQLPSAKLALPEWWISPITTSKASLKRSLCPRTVWHWLITDYWLLITHYWLLIGVSHSFQIRRSLPWIKGKISWDPLYLLTTDLEIIEIQDLLTPNRPWSCIIWSLWETPIK